MKDRAFAKINLCLDVIGGRSDGYHELKMIMAPLDFYDVVEMNIADKTTLSVNRSYLPNNDKNTVIKVINTMRDMYYFKEQFACTITKHIPTQAGLAGGSADGASAIRLIDRLLKLNLTRKEKLKIASKIGSDVPFCVLNEPAYVEGTGDVILPFENNTDFHLLLVKPRKGVSTKQAFDMIDKREAIHPDCLKMKHALEDNDYFGVVDALGNSLEGVAIELVPDIQTIKEQLIKVGFDGALMSGSGSTVFGITRDERLVDASMPKFRDMGYFVRKTKIYKKENY